MVRTLVLGLCLLASPAGAIDVTAPPPAVPIGQLVNVRNFGARCDGTTDDTTAITNAIASLTASRGGTVFLPPGDCKTTSQITLTTFNVTIEGSGSANNATNLASTILYTPTTTGTAAIYVNGANGGQRAGLRHLAIKQNNAQGSTQCVQISGQQARLVNVSCLSFTGSSFALWADATGGVGSIWNLLESTYAQPAAGGIGYHLKGIAAGNLTVNANTFTRILASMPTVAQGGTSGQVNFKTEGPVSDNTILGSDLSPADVGTGVLLGDGSNTCRGNQIFNSTIEGSAGSTNVNIAANCIGFLLDAFMTAAGTVTINSGANGWVFDTRQGIWYTAGSTGLQITSAGIVTAASDIRLGSNGGAFRQLNQAGNSQIAVLSLDGAATDGILLGNGLPSGGIVNIGQGAIQAKVGNGLQVGSPTGGDKGAGAVNAATALYLNGVQAFPVGGTLTCSANCGTSPSITGNYSNFDVVIGTSPPAASTFTVTFGTAWAGAPNCTAQRGTTGTTPVVTGVVTTTGTAVVNLSANLVASERYHVQCGGVS